MNTICPILANKEQSYEDQLGEKDYDNDTFQQKSNDFDFQEYVREINLSEKDKKELLRRRHRST